MITEPSSGAALDEAVLAAVVLKPMSRRALASVLKVSPSALGLACARVANAGRVTEAGGTIGLPNAPSDFDGGGRSLEEQARALWQRRSILCLFPVDVPDPLLRERLMLLGNALYGRRRGLHQ